mmetsp:Transcript_6499/g.18122  ORF Transcript_6499/g.18122 Transcript_6499/m.18122 type:complete len:250 (+) Transcript_6499:1198-1947(+)
MLDCALASRAPPSRPCRRSQDAVSTSPPRSLLVLATVSPRASALLTNAPRYSPGFSALVPNNRAILSPDMAWAARVVTASSSLTASNSLTVSSSHMASNSPMASKATTAATRSRATQRLGAHTTPIRPPMVPAVPLVLRRQLLPTLPRRRQLLAPMISTTTISFGMLLITESLPLVSIMVLGRRQRARPILTAMPARKLPLQLWPPLARVVVLPHQLLPPLPPPRPPAVLPPLPRIPASAKECRIFQRG